MSILMVIVILGVGAGAYANREEAFGNHWSKDIIEMEFFTSYFSYLGRENFKRLDLDGNITKKDIITSLGTLGKDYDFEVKLDGLLNENPLTREEMVIELGKVLKGFNVEKSKKVKLPFKDIDRMDSRSIELLGLLYDLKIINGVSPEEFAPKKELSQAEGIIILQRLKGVLESMEEISFKTMGIMQSYNGEESIKMNNSDNKVTLTITKAFPTPGYSLSVDKVVPVEEGYKVYLKSTRPSENMMQPQVITYKTITIEIEKEQLMKPEPYTFIVEGDDFPSGL